VTRASVHVSIHDVAPPFRPQVERALEMAGAEGARPALLVVPDYHGEAPLAQDAEFCAWLRGLQRAGHELFLHGYSHRARHDPRTRGLSWYFRQRVVSAGEAEMSDLSRDEASERLDRGERALTDAGLRVDGFVAPAWSMPRWLLPMLAARGCPYSEDHLRVYAPREGARRASLVLNYASRTPARLFSSVAFCRAATPLGALVRARIAIHPADMHHGLLRREIARLLAWGRGRFVARGADLLSP
jgi:predicted deacetylase